MSSPIEPALLHVFVEIEKRNLKRTELEMSSEALQVAKVYRNLLKAVKNHIGREDNKRHFREYVTKEFRKNSIPSDLSSIQQKIKLASDYTFLLNSVHHHKVLLIHCSN